MKTIMSISVAFAVIATAAAAQMRGAPKLGQTKEQAASLAARAFQRLDQSGDGSVDAAEATIVLQARATKNGRKFRPRAAQRTIARNDGNGDGKVSLDEFKAAAAKRFEAADTNKNGVIDAAEASMPATPDES